MGLADSGATHYRLNTFLCFKIWCPIIRQCCDCSSVFVSVFFSKVRTYVKSSPGEDPRNIIVHPYLGMIPRSWRDWQRCRCRRTRAEKGITSMYRACHDPHEPETDIVCAGGGFTSLPLDSARKRFSRRCRNDKRNIGGPVVSPWCTSLEQAIVRCSPETLRERIS